MTCHYSEINLFDAISIASRRYPGGIEALAQRIGIRVPQVLRNKITPSNEQNHLTVEELTLIVESLRTAGREKEADLIIDAFNWMFGRVATKLPGIVSPGGGDLTSHLLHVMRHTGEIAADLESALIDGKISAIELDALEKRVQESTEAQLQLLELLRQQHRKQYAYAQSGH
jgi:hypothetical protein